MKQSITSGFTLIELMITVVIAGIILAATLPQLNQISNQISFSSIQQSLVSNLLFARSEAVRTGGQTGVCASDSIESTITSCSSSSADWSSGWIVFHDRNNNGTFDPPYNHSSGSASRGPTDDEMLKMHHVDSTAIITWDQSNTIAFQGDGTATADSVGTFKLCDSKGDTNTAQGVTVSLAGRVRSTEAVTCP